MGVSTSAFTGWPTAMPQRRRADLALALIDSDELPVVVCNHIGELAIANAAARRLWDLPEHLGNASVACSTAFLEVDRAHPLRRVLDGEERLSDRYALAAGAGAPTPVDVRARAVRGRDGCLLGAMMTVSVIDPQADSQDLLRNYASDIQTLTEVSRLLSEVQDPDEAASIICTVATGAMGAVAVLLWESVAGRLVIRHHEGMLDADDIGEIGERARDGAARAQVEARTVVDRLTEPGDEPPAPDDVEAMLGTVWHEPLVTGSEVEGVLSIVWAGFLDDVDRLASLIGPLAHHAATGLERARLVRRLGDAARTDALTGVANRRTWQESLQRALDQARRSDRPISLVLIDIDHFKSFNDRFGHPEGDRLLRDAAGAWAATLRSDDLLARVGGEEFAVLLPDCPHTDACLVAERLRASTPHGQTCSLGVATWDRAASPADLYAIADAALYRAKHAGRNRVESGG